MIEPNCYMKTLSLNIYTYKYIHSASSNLFMRDKQYYLVNINTNNYKEIWNYVYAYRVYSYSWYTYVHTYT